MAQLRMARELAAKGKFDDARRFIALTSDAPDAHVNDDTLGSIATTLIVLARAQLKAGDREGARATLTDAARIAFTLTRTGSPLKLETLRDVADAEIDAGDLDGARAALTAAVPLVVIYNDPDHSRLAIVTDQLKAGDKDGAQKTAALMTDPALKAKALAEIASPPPPPKPGDQPLSPPLPSQYSRFSFRPAAASHRGRGPMDEPAGTQSRCPLLHRFLRRCRPRRHRPGHPAGTGTAGPPRADARSARRARTRQQPHDRRANRRRSPTQKQFGP